MNAELGSRTVVAGLLCVLLTWESAAQASPPPANPQPGDPASVVPIDWSRFRKPATLDKDYRDCEKLLQNCARFNLAWIAKSFSEDRAAQAYMLVRFDEHGVRPACSAVYGMATLLKCDGFDPDAVGLSRPVALERTVKLLRGAALAHRSNKAGKAAWGDHWQSALWSALLGCGGWLLWDDLDPAARQALVNVVVHEADRMSRHQVPYWRDAAGERFRGDTKAEENAWNSMVLNVAVAMMPRHPHVHAWKLKASELMVSAYSTEADWRSNRAVLDGREVRDWLRGYNALPNGAVVNHGFLHPDYMSDEKLNLWAYLTQSLSGGPVPQTAAFNGPLIYRTFATHRWESPPYRSPGGTIYRENQADVYYPKGSDWSMCDLSNFYLNDVWAHVLGWDHDLPQKAIHWMRLRAARMLQMQERHADRRMFAPKEYDTYPGAEQMMAWLLADALWALRLHAFERMGHCADWLGASPDAIQAKLLAARPVTIACLGDSVTGVYYHTGGRRAYPEMIPAAIQSVFPQASVHVVNAGVSGNTTAEGLNRLQKDVLDAKPDLVTVMFGLNDMVRVPRADFQANLARIIERCRQAGAEVLLCTPNSVFDTAGRSRAKLADYCDAMGEVGRKHGVPVCDIFAAYERLRTADPAAWRLLLSDEIHPNMDGHKLNAEEIARTITGRAASPRWAGSPEPAIPKTLALLEAGKPVRVLAMTPYDRLIEPALRAVAPAAKVQVTAWPVDGRTLAQIEQSAQKVRAAPPDLVLIAVPTAATPAAERPPEAAIRAYSWILNWSLSFGRQEWDVVGIAPSVLKTSVTADERSRDQFARGRILAQDLGLIARPPGDGSPPEQILANWIRRQRAVKANDPTRRSAESTEQGAR